MTDISLTKAEKENLCVNCLFEFSKNKYKKNIDESYCERAH